MESTLLDALNGDTETSSIRNSDQRGSNIIHIDLFTIM